MMDLLAGSIVVSLTGHDAGKCYVIIQSDKEYVYLVDGKIRTLKNSKKKKKKHIKLLQEVDQTLTDKIANQTIRDEEIKRVIKLYQRSLQG